MRKQPRSGHLRPGPAATGNERKYVTPSSDASCSYTPRYMHCVQYPQPRVVNVVSGYTDGLAVSGHNWSRFYPHYDGSIGGDFGEVVGRLIKIY